MGGGGIHNPGLKQHANGNPPYYKIATEMSELSTRLLLHSRLSLSLSPHHSRLKIDLLQRSNKVAFEALIYFVFPFLSSPPQATTSRPILSIHSENEAAMETEKEPELAALLKVLPPVEFCCVYGSALHPNNSDKSSMVDYILGVADPLRWHTENLKINRDHYASWMVHLGGAKLITDVADEIGVGVHFNPFVIWKDKMFKYGVVRMDDLIRDIFNWERFYLSGRLQKPVCVLVDNLDIGNINSVNLRAATSAALLLSPSKFLEENLYARICSLSYMGDLRMFFAEDKNKVNKIVEGQFTLFQSMYKPILEEFAAKDLLRFTSSAGNQVNVSQDYGLSAASSLVSRLPPAIRSDMAFRLGNETHLSNSGQVTRELVIGSREEAAECMRKIVRRRVMVSSARQAVSGLLTVGAVSGVRYLANKMHKAWKSWT